MQNQKIKDRLLSVPEEAYGPLYKEHYLDLYKLYYSTCDHISDRRLKSNVFFLTLHTSIIAFTGYAANQVALVSLAGIFLAVVWHFQIRAYKGLNKGKFTIIHLLEEKLPLALFDAEWLALEKGDNSKTYLPFTQIEILIPWVFGALHLIALIFSLFNN